MTLKKIWPILVLLPIFFVIFIYFSYRLTLVPDGLTVDEASIGYNAVLISKTLRDETGRLLPIFALTINKTNWKQPSSIYASALYFRLFGPSLFNLRVVSVLVATISFFVVVYLNYLLLGKVGALFSAICYLATPLVVIHSHLAQENIWPLLFVSIWLLCILLSEKNKNLWYLVLSGLSLGVGIYCYKGMRALVPPMAILSFLYLFFTQTNKKSVLFFSLGFIPFVLPIPWINNHYAGALFDNTQLSFLRFNEFFYPYLSSFDFTGLFIKGDITPWHSTGIHGAFLLATMPAYIVGLIILFRQTRNANYWKFLFLGYVLTPLLYGQAGSLSRFSRLLVFVPYIITFTSLGFITIMRGWKGKFVTAILMVLLTLNYFDFVQFYWYTYPKATSNVFNENTEKYFQELAKLANKYNLSPYMNKDDYYARKENSQFFESAYFNKPLTLWSPGDALPSNGILLTSLGVQPDTKLLINNNWNYRYLVNIDKTLP